MTALRQATAVVCRASGNLTRRRERPSSRRPRSTSTPRWVDDSLRAESRLRVRDGREGLRFSTAGRATVSLVGHRVRRAVVDDARAIAALNGFVQALHVKHRPDRFKVPDVDALVPVVEGWLRSANRRLWLAEDETGVPVGYIMGVAVRSAVEPVGRRRVDRRARPGGCRSSSSRPGDRQSPVWRGDPMGVRRRRSTCRVVDLGVQRVGAFTLRRPWIHAGLRAFQPTRERRVSGPCRRAATRLSVLGARRR